MERRRFLKMAACLPLFGLCPVTRIGSQDVPAFDTRNILLLLSPVAGLRHHGGQRALAGVSPGDPLTLRREPLNPHDGRAVALYWKGEKLGYLPREDNRVIAGLLDQGAPVDAHIVGKNAGETVEVKVELHR
jgi:hypothetical protein